MRRAATRRRRSSFADLDARYKRYDVRQGFGGPREWRQDFNVRMGFEEAQRIINEGDETPRGILGVTKWATWAEIVAAYRKKALATHPDRAAMNGMSVEAATTAFQKIQAAYSVLAAEFGR